MPFDRAAMKQPMVIAHRGASSIMPENTIPAFERAVELNADGIELDVRLTRDRVPVVIHDENLRRTTGHDGEVRLATAGFISTLDAGMGCNPKGPVRIPTLDDVLEHLRNADILLIVEIKGQRGHAEEAARIVGHALHHAALRREPMVSSSDAAVLMTLKKHYPLLATALIVRRGLFSFVASLLSANLAPMRGLHVQGLHVHHRALSQRMVSRAKQHNMHVFAWGIDTADQAQDALALGIDGIIADDVEMASGVRSRFFPHET